VGDELRSELIWHAGRRCDSGACVEIAALDEAVLVRSSLAPGLTLTVTRPEWQEFLAGAKEGLFDHL
jgi:hypothetical protein